MSTCCDNWDTAFIGEKDWLDLWIEFVQQEIDTVLEWYCNEYGASSSTDSWYTMLQYLKVTSWFPVRLLKYFNLPTPFSHTTSWSLLIFWQKWASGDLSECKRQPTRIADSLTAIYEPIVYKSRLYDVSEHYTLHGLLLGYIFAVRRVLRDQRGGSPTVVNLRFLDRSRYFSFK
jgi:hypothetical protein